MRLRRNPKGFLEHPHRGAVGKVNSSYTFRTGADESNLIRWSHFSHKLPNEEFTLKAQIAYEEKTYGLKYAETAYRAEIQSNLDRLTIQYKFHQGMEGMSETGGKVEAVLFEVDRHEAIQLAINLLAAANGETKNAAWEPPNGMREIPRSELQKLDVHPHWLDDSVVRVTIYNRSNYHIGEVRLWVQSPAGNYERREVIDLRPLTSANVIVALGQRINYETPQRESRPREWVIERINLQSATGTELSSERTSLQAAQR